MMNPSIEEVTRWLQSKSNHTLHISKQEEKDQDQIKIQLERFEHQQRSRAVHRRLWRPPWLSSRMLPAAPVITAGHHGRP